MIVRFVGAGRHLTAAQVYAVDDPDFEAISAMEHLTLKGQPGAYPWSDFERVPRSGSYPLMNLAEDFALDYGDVLLAWQLTMDVADAAKAGAYDLPEGRADRGCAAVDRIIAALTVAGAGRREAFSDRLAALIEARRAL